MNYYLHKHKKEEITTTKDRIIFDIDKVNNNYKFVYNHLKKYPSVLEIIGENSVTFNRMTFCFDFPVEKVIINASNIITFSSMFYNFYNIKTLELTNVSKSINLKDYLGLRKLENIIIPFSISKFRNENVFDKSNLKTLTICNNDDKLILDLDECLLNKRIDINIKKNDDKLHINIVSENIDIEYNVYLNDNKLTYDKKYNKYEINGDDYTDNILNIIELKKIYKDITFIGKFKTVNKVILNKSDIDILTKDIFNFLKEIEIIDDNSMSLLPRNLNVKLNDKTYESFKLIEKLGSNLLIFTNNPRGWGRYMIINDDLSLINLGSVYFLTLILDYDANKCTYENFTLTIPFNKEIDQRNSFILKHFIEYSTKIIVKKNDKTYNLTLKDLSIINYIDDDSFEVEYLHEILLDCGESYRKVIGEYKFNNKPEFYHEKGKVLKKDLNRMELPRR